MQRDKKLIRILVNIALVALLTCFLLPGLTAPVASAGTNIGNQITPETTFALVHSNHVSPLNVQEAPPATNITDSLAPDETMSPISTPFSYNDCLIPPLLPQKEASSLSPSPGPGPDDQSEYMIGDVAVTLIFPESDGSGDQDKENWSVPRMNTCLNEIRAGLDWWEEQYLGTGVNLSFTIYSYYDDYGKLTSRATSYEPITRPHTDQGLWINEILTGLGYTSGSYMQKVEDLNSYVRDLYNTNWAYTIFVVDSLNDADGEFTDGYSAYAYIGGPFVVLTYDCGNWGISDMDRVAAHETGHIFYATDEYDSTPEYSGYLNIRDNDGAYCIMNNNDWNLCSSTEGQVGWRDSDGDGILDPVDTFPDIVLSPYSPDPTTNNVLVYAGTAQDIPLANHNPNGPGNDVTINTITTVQYRIDNGTWYNTTSDDGAFDEVTEAFTFTTPPLSSGTHVIQTRAQNSVGNWETSYSTDTVEIDTTNPTVTLNGIPDFAKSLPSISGTAADTTPGQVDRVRIQIKNTTNNTYWNGISWITTETWLNATGTTSWSYSMPLLTDSKSYQVKVKSLDKAGNESPITSDGFIFDVTSPTVILDNIPDSVKLLTSISGTASDTTPGQVDKVRVQIRNTTDNTYWNGSSWATVETWLDATGTTSWSYSLPLLTKGKAYIARAESIDKAGNESSIVSDSFTFDATNPTVTLNNIADFVKSLTSIDGTASDTAPGQVDRVQIQIRNTTDSTYWDGSSWVTTATWLNATGTTSWSYTIPLLPSDKSYEVKVKSVDKAGNESSIASDSFTFDDTNPTVTLNDIPDFVKSPPSISGTSADTASGQVDRVQVQIKNTTNSLYWNGSSWVTAETWLNAIETTSWSYSMPSLPSDKSYEVKVKSIDKAGNESTLASDSFTFDVTNPTVVLDNIPDLVKLLTSVSGTASDTTPGQVDKVRVQIKNTTDSTYWNGSSWVTTETWLDATGITSWSYSIPSLPSDKSYTVKVKSVDKAGNESPIASGSFIFDATNPTVTLNNIADFVKLLTSISGTASDTAPGQVDKVRVQIKNTTNNTYWNGNSWVIGENWLDATGTTSWSCSMPSLPSDKSYEVQVKSIDKAGNESPIASDNFIFDTTNPTVTLDNIPDSVKSLHSINGTASDTPPGQVDKVQIQIRNTTDSTYWNGSSWATGETWLDATGTTSWSYSIPLLTKGKSYQLTVKSIDKAGNESSIVLDSFTCHIPPPIWIWVVVGVAGVLAIGIVLIILGRRLARR